MSPDAYVVRCWNHFGRGAPGLDYVDSRGRWYFKTCRGCRARIRHFSHAKDRYVCGKCGRDWPYEDRIVAKGVVQRSPKVDGANERMSGSAGLRLLLDRFVEEVGWDAKVYVVKVVTGKTREEMAHAGKPEAFVGFPKPWTPRCIGDAVRAGRLAWTARLEEAGLPVG